MKTTTPCRPGDVLELSIVEMAGREALAKLDGYPIFIADTIPGDRVLGQIISAKPTYARAQLQEVLEAAPHRILSPCPIIKACGGCQWGQMAYEEQLRQKQRLLTEALAHAAGDAITGCIRPIIPSPRPYRYRNKNQFVIGSFRRRLYAAFYRQHSHEKVEVPACYQQPEELDEALAIIVRLLQAEQLTAYDEPTGRGYLRHLILRRGESTGEILVGLVTRTRGRESLPRLARRIRKSLPKLVGVVQNINTPRTNVILGAESLILDGRGYYYERLAGLELQISLPSFFQVHTAQAQALLETIGQLAALGRNGRVCDAYAGVGTISLYMARRSGSVVAIEEALSAVADGRANARHNHITNVDYRAGTVEEHLPQVLAAGKPIDILILDPPRAGCSRAVLDAVTGSGIERVIYSSCHPATLARDIAILAQADFRVRDVQPIDMFPQTYHLEVVTLLER